MSNPSPTPIFASSTELADLGRARFNHDTAQATDRDASLYSAQPVSLRQGRAPCGLEGQVFAWNTFKYTTEERDEREEMKGDLHDGQLHRQNRAARGEEGPLARGDFGGARGGFAGSAGNRAARKREQGGGVEESLCAGRKVEGWGLAKGFAEELSKDMFWDGELGKAERKK
jgi:hypothetical protein